MVRFYIYFKDPHDHENQAMKQIDFIKNMATLKIQKNDILVIRVNYPIAAEVADAIKESVLKALPQAIKAAIGILVFDSAAEIGVLRSEK